MKEEINSSREIDWRHFPESDCVNNRPQTLPQLIHLFVHLMIREEVAGSISCRSQKACFDYLKFVVKTAKKHYQVSIQRKWLKKTKISRGFSVFEGKKKLLR